MGEPPGSVVFRDVSLERLRAAQAAFADARDWQQFHTPRNLLLALTGEVGELAELFQWRSDAEAQRLLPGFTPAERTAVADELSDVLLYLIRMSDVCGIDLADAALRKIEKNARKYPPDQCRGSARKYTEYAHDTSPVSHLTAGALAPALSPNAVVSPVATAVHGG